MDGDNDGGCDGGDDDGGDDGDDGGGGDDYVSYDCAGGGGCAAAAGGDDDGGGGDVYGGDAGIGDDVMFWNSPCVFAMRCGKNRTLFDFLPGRQITRAGSACMEMIHGFKEGWIIWHPLGYPRGSTRAG